MTRTDSGSGGAVRRALHRLAHWFGIVYIRVPLEHRRGLNGEVLLSCVCATCGKWRPLNSKHWREP